MRQAAVVAFGVVALAAASSAAEAAPVTYACPTVFGTDRVVIDTAAGKAQIVGESLAMLSPNYALPLQVQAVGGNATLIPPFSPGGGAMIPGTESTALRLQANGSLVAEEYARETVLGNCAVSDPLTFVELKLPVPSPAGPFALTCVPWDTTGATVADWRQVPDQAYRLAFDPATGVTRQGPADAAPVSLAPRFQDSGQKVQFVTARPAGFALNRYSGNLFESTFLDALPGRLVATCGPAA